jgi:hypothetical protein
LQTKSLTFSNSSPLATLMQVESSSEKLFPMYLVLLSLRCNSMNFHIDCWDGQWSQDVHLLVLLSSHGQGQ